MHWVHELIELRFLGRNDAAAMSRKRARCRHRLRPSRDRSALFSAEVDLMIGDPPRYGIIRDVVPIQRRLECGGRFGRPWRWWRRSAERSRWWSAASRAQPSEPRVPPVTGGAGDGAKAFGLGDLMPAEVWPSRCRGAPRCPLAAPTLAQRRQVACRHMNSHDNRDDEAVGGGVCISGVNR